MPKYTYDYPHPAVTVDIVIFDVTQAGIEVLLIKRGGEPYKGMWALPGGFMDIHEDALHAAERELREETSLDGIELKQIGAFTAPFRDPRERVVSIAYAALVNKAEVKPKAGDDAAEAQWFSIRELPALAFDHSKILRVAMYEVCA